MIIIYYTDNKDGKIISHHNVNDELTLKEVGEMVRAFNLTNKNGRTAHIFDAETGGFVAYLFEKAVKRKQYDKKIVQDAIDSLEEAMDFVRSLM